MLNIFECLFCLPIRNANLAIKVHFLALAVYCLGTLRESVHVRDTIVILSDELK